MSFVTQDDVFAAVEPVLRGVFEEFGGGQPVTPKLPHDPLQGGDAQIWRRQAGPAQPDRIADLTEVSRATTSRSTRSRTSSRRAGWCAPFRRRGRRGSRARSSTSSTTGQGEGAPGLGYVLFEGEGEALVGKGPIAKFLPAAAQREIVAKAGLRAGDAVFFACDKEAKSAKLAGAARIRIGNELGVCKNDVFEFGWIVDFPMYRMGRGREEDRILAQSVLDAARRPGGSDDDGPARDQGLPVRHRVQRLSSSSPAPSATTGRT